MGLLRHEALRAEVLLQVKKKEGVYIAIVSPSAARFMHGRSTQVMSERSESPLSKRRLTICIVGSGGVGKSSLTVRYLQGTFPEVRLLKVLGNAHCYDYNIILTLVL